MEAEGGGRGQEFLLCREVKQVREEGEGCKRSGLGRVPAQSRLSWALGQWHGGGRRKGTLPFPALAPWHGPACVHCPSVRGRN